MYKAVVIGVSAGGLKALKAIIPELPKDWPLTVIVVQHLASDSDDFLVTYLDDMSPIAVSQAQSFEALQSAHVYLAPPGYHLYIEEDESFGLSVDPRVNFSMPSIDVLFESAAEVYGESLIGIVLTGANFDGSQGLKIIKEHGGLTVVEDPQTAEVPTMPLAAIAASEVDQTLPLGEIVNFLKGVIYEQT
jgi:two-component system chemotaxis response regulator CheB